MELKQQFKLGECTILPDEHCVVYEDGTREPLQPKFIEVLWYLANHYPRVIPRQELIDAIWSSNDYVGEKALTNAIWHLRQKLKNVNTDSDLDIIETIRKVGYKLNNQPVWVEEIKEEPVTTADHTNALNNEEQQPEAEHQPNYIPMASVAGVLVILFYFVWHYIQDHYFQVEQVIEQVTYKPGAELFAAPSPDGRYLVYAWSDSTTSTNLFLRDITQPELPAKQLTFDGLVQGISAWNMDNKRLYFAKKSQQDKTCDIIELDVQSQQESVVTQCTFSGGYYYLDVSADGKTLAYQGRHKGAKNSGIYFIELDKKDAVPVRFSCEGQSKCGYRDRDMAFSPDGKKIAVTRRMSRFNENLYIVDIKTKEAEQVSFGEEDIVGLTWHPNGEQIVYGTQRADVRQGMVYNIDKKQHQQLSINGFSYPEFAKQSATLFFQQRKEDYHISSIQLNSEVASSPYPIVQSGFSHHYPSYSEAVNKLVYVSNESGNYELWTSDIDGNQRQQLTTLKRTIRYPRWSHKGDKVAFLARAENGEGDRIYIIDVTTKRINEVNTGYTRHNRPTWTTDDSAIVSAVSVNSRSELYLIDVDNGAMEKLTKNRGRLGVMLDESRLLYSSLDGGLWLTDITQKTENQVQNVIPSETFRSIYSWAQSSSGIYFNMRQQGFSVLSFYSFVTQEIEPVIQLPRGFIHSSASLNYVESDNKLIFPQSALPQSDIKILQHPLIASH